MANTPIFRKDLLICKGCDYAFPVIVQDKYKFTHEGEEGYWYDLIQLDDVEIKLSIYNSWINSGTGKKPLIYEFTSVPGEFGESTSDGNIIGIDGKFSAILHDDANGDAQDKYLGIHIPNNITEAFTFMKADYELTMITNSGVEPVIQLLAQGTIEIFGGSYV